MDAWSLDKNHLFMDYKESKIDLDICIVIYKKVSIILICSLQNVHSRSGLNHSFYVTQVDRRSCISGCVVVNQMLHYSTEIHLRGSIKMGESHTRSIII